MLQSPNIGQYLRKAKSLVRYVKAEKDADIFGQVSENALWEQIV